MRMYHPGNKPDPEVERPVAELEGRLLSESYGGIWGIECRLDQQAAVNVLGVQPVHGMPLKVTIKPK